MLGDVCFGCGSENTAGLRIRSFWDPVEGSDHAVCRWQPDPRYQGWPDITCGGIIATLIDCHCMATAMATAIRNENRPLASKPHYRFATGVLNIRYLKPTPIDASVELHAWVVDISNARKYTLNCELYAAGEKTVEAEVIAILVYRGTKPITGG